MTRIMRSLLFISAACFAGILTAQEPIKIESALTCRECHEAIYDQWSNSRHARSTPTTNVLFKNIYELSQKDTNGETKLYCIRCHAPVSQTNGDVDLQQEITNEGVTCDICHTITGLTDHPNNWPNVYEPGRVKRGPHEDVEVEEHEAVYSELFENSRICSGCHGNMLNIPGTRSCGNLTICDTDFEWKETTIGREGKSCVDCHMTGILELFISKKVERTAQHDFSGAYSHGKLQEAAKLVLDVKEFGGEIIAAIQIVNEGAGHLLPTGPPARMGFIKVRAFDRYEEEVWSNYISNPSKEDPFGVFHIVFANQEGKVPSMPWLASRIVKDTRIRPGENRQLVYKFPSEGVARVEAKLFYRLAPPPLLDKFEISDETLRKSYLMAQVEKSLTAE